MCFLASNASHLESATPNPEPLKLTVHRCPLVQIQLSLFLVIVLQSSLIAIIKNSVIAIKEACNKNAIINSFILIS